SWVLNWVGGDHPCFLKKATPGSLFSFLLAFDFPVNQQHNYRANYGDHEAAEVKAINFPVAKESTNPTTNNSTCNPQNDGHKEATTIFTWHDPFRQDTSNQTKNNP